tara:strand:+ start:129233 stop:130072 length:840 start_codon:yes stop_codon:yes gene_type:complete
MEELYFQTKNSDFLARQLRELWQRRTIYFLSSFIGISAIIIFLIRFFVEKQSLYSSLVLFFVGVFFFCIGRLTLSQSSPGLVGHLLLCFGSVILPIRIMVTGGLSGTGIIFLPMLNCFLVYMVGKKWSLIYIHICFFWLLVLELSPLRDFFISSDTIAIDQFLRFVFMYLAILFGSGLSFVIENTKDSLIDTLIKNKEEIENSHELVVRQEKEKAINSVISSYNDEINNPLFIALGNLKRYKDDPDSHNFDRLEKSLERIREITKNIEQTAKRELEGSK